MILGDGGPRISIHASFWSRSKTGEWQTNCPLTNASLPQSNTIIVQMPSWLPSLHHPLALPKFNHCQSSPSSFPFIQLFTPISYLYLPESQRI